MEALGQDFNDVPIVVAHEADRAAAVAQPQIFVVKNGLQVVEFVLEEHMALLPLSPLPHFELDGDEQDDHNHGEEEQEEVANDYEAKHAHVVAVVDAAFLALHE